MVNSWEHRIQDNGANNKNTNWTGTPRCRKCLVALLLYSGWQIDVSVRCSDATTTSQTGAIYIVHSSAMWPRGLPLLLVNRRTAPETLHISSHRRSLLLSFFLRSSRGYLQKTEQLRQVPAFWSCFMCFSIYIYIYYLPRNAENRGGHRSNGCVQFLPPLPCCLTCSGDSDFLPLLNAVAPPSQFCRITLSRQETPNRVGGGGEGGGGGGGWGWWWWWWRRRRWWWEEDDDVEEEDVEEEGRSQDIPRPGSTPCASLRRRNEHGHVTRGVLHASDTTSTEYRALTLTVRTPQCGHTVWGKTSINPAASSLLWRALLFDIFWSSQGHKVPNGHFSELFLGFHYEVNIGVRHSLSQHHASSTLKGLGLTLKWLLAQRAWMVLRGGVSESQYLGGDAPDITRLTWSDLRSCDEVCQRRLDTKQVTSKELLSLGTSQGVYVRQNAAQVLALQFPFLAMTQRGRDEHLHS